MSAPGPATRSAISKMSVMTLSSEMGWIDVDGRARTMVGAIVVRRVSATTNVDLELATQHAGGA
jgi:hypothetical protein